MNNEEKNIITKEKMIALIMESQAIAEEDVVMIGDRNTDIDAAHFIGIKSIGVTYGFGSEAELFNANATYLAHNVQQLQAILHQL